MLTRNPPWTRLALVAVVAVPSACGAEGPTAGSTEVVEIVVAPASATMQALGETANVRAEPRSPSGASLQRRIQWSTSNSSVATVSPSGDLNENAQITARGNGTALIAAATDGVTGGVQVTVEQSVASFAFVDSPGDALLGASAGTVSVAVLDPGQSPVVGANGPVTVDVDSGSPGALIGGARVGTLANGVAVFDDLRVDQLGQGYRLEATWDGRSASSRPFSVVEAFDAVRVANGNGEAGLLVDGFQGGSVLNDWVVRSDQPIVEVGVVDAAAFGRNEVVVFAPARRPALSAAAWSSQVDTVDVVLEAPLEIDLTIWIVRGPFGSQSARALDAVQTTRTIWTDERAGIVIDSVEVIDATGDPDAAQLLRPTLCNSKDDLENLIGKTDGTINVYYVETVDGGTDRGRACPLGGDHAIMAERSGDELLSHEMGHLLSLTHVDGIVQHFDPTNVMHSSSNRRQYLTEGQIFRQQLDPRSVLNGIFGLRTSEGRSCPRDTATGSCPAIESRVWADGGFGATLVGASAGHPRDIAHRWVEVSCEMGDNEGLTDRLRRAGSEAVRTLALMTTTDPDPEHRRVALDGLATLGGAEARRALGRAEALPELRIAARAARRRLEREAPDAGRR